MAEDLPIATDGYARYYTEKLWNLIPELYRTADGEQRDPHVLRAIVEAIAEQAAETRRSIDGLWENQHIETCDDWAVPYISHLLGTRLVSALDTRARRVDVAQTVYFRRRRGTPHLLETMVRRMADWDVVLVEAFRRLGRTWHGLDGRVARVGRISGTPQGGTADLRRPLAAEFVDSPFEEYARTPDVRRSQGRDGRFNLRKLNFHLYRLRAFAVAGATPYTLRNDGLRAHTVDPSGRDIPLFSRGDRTERTRARLADPALRRERESECGPLWPWEVTGPLSCRLFAHEEYELSLEGLAQITDPDSLEFAALRSIVGVRFRSRAALRARLMQLGAPNLTPPLPPGMGPPWYFRLLEVALTDDSAKAHLYPRALAFETSDGPLPGRYVMSGDLNSRIVHPDPEPPEVIVLVSPETGRFARTPPSVDQAVPDVALYHYGFSAEIGAGTYARPTLLGGARPAERALPGADSQIQMGNGALTTIADNRRYSVTQAAGNRIAESTWQAGDGARPYLRLEASSRAIWPVLQGGARITVDGLWLGSASDDPSEVVIQGRTPAERERGTFDWDEICIRHTTLDPGGTRADGTSIAPLVLRVRGHVKRLVIERSIVAAILVDNDGSQAERGFIEQLEIHDSIVDGLSDATPWAIDSVLGEVHLERVTVFGDLRAERLFASNTLIMGTVHVTDHQGGCFRFSAASPGGKLPPRYESLPPASKQPPATSACERVLAPIVVEPSFFTSTRFGDPGYAQLSLVAPASLCEGGEDGRQMGVFASLLEPIRLRSIQTKVDEYQPVGLIAQYLFET